MKNTRGLWLREQLSDLMEDVLTTERSNLPLFNKGLETKCTIDTTLEKILDNKESAPAAFELLKDIKEHLAACFWLTRK